jgi:hypothetical protein
LGSKRWNLGLVNLCDVGDRIGEFYDCKENKGRDYSGWEYFEWKVNICITTDLLDQGLNNKRLSMVRGYGSRRI